MNTPVSLDTVIVTAELDRRESRHADHQAESVALVALMKALKTPGSGILRELAETALRLCRAASAGVGIVEELDGDPVFRWHAAAGRCAEFAQRTLRHRVSPCGAVLDRNAPLLMRHPERHFDFAMPGVPPIVEMLLVPFEFAGRIVGTVWVMLHDERRKFDREDLRVLRNLGEFAAVAYHVTTQQKQIGDALEREVAGSQWLQSIGAAIPDGDTRGLYERILDAATAIMRSQFASLQAVTRNGELRLLACRGFHEKSARHWGVVTPGSATSSADTLRARQRFVVADTELSPALVGTRDLDEFRRSGIRSMQSTPLLSRSGKLVGVVSTHWHHPGTPSASDLRIFDVLARQAADLIERANAEAAASEADRRKDEFLAVLGHELRNPLAPLTTGIELLGRAGRKPDLVDSIQAMMQRQMVHLTRLVDDLLDHSRITRGQIELQRAPLDLRFVVEAAAELTQPWIDERAHLLSIERAAAPLWVDGDLERLTQVIANLIGNAAKYMDPGGDIVVRCEAAGGDAVVRVRDRGFGIPPDRLEEIFEMFSQVPEHRVRRGGGGLGIGLALSRRLIELHGGKLEARSDGLDRGSEFIVRLPLSSAPVALQRVPPEAPGPAATPRRVLVVDDNVDAAASLRAALEMGGHVVEVAHDGPASFAAFERFRPQVLLLDIGLPQVDGYELARRFRSLPAGDELLLIAVTGWGQDSDRERAREAGFDAHMTKPVSLAALETMLRGGGG